MTLTDIRFRQLVVGAAAACHMRDSVVARLEQQEADARRWRAYRKAVLTGDTGFIGRVESYPLKDPNLPTPDELDRAVDAAIQE